MVPMKSSLCSQSQEKLRKSKGIVHNKVFNAPRN